MHIHLTKKMIDWLEPTLIEKDTENDLYAWHANFQLANRKKFILLTNDLTRFSIVLFGMTKKDFKEPEFIIYNAVLHALLNAGFELELIDKYMRNLEKITYGKTKNRTLVARLNRAMMDALNIAFEDGLDFKNFEQNHVSLISNSLIVGENKAKTYFVPNERMGEYLNLL